MNPSYHNLNRCIISALKDVTQNSEENICDILVDILPVGKDAIYRRLRNEVAFSFDEIVRISQKLNLSIDNIIRSEKEDSAIININMNDSLSITENYCNIIDNYTKILKGTNSDPHAEAKLAFNTIPDGFFSFKELTKFRIYRWRYLTSNYTTPQTLNEFEIPETVDQLHKLFVKETCNVAKSSLVLDRNTFRSFFNEIKYFHRLYLISDETLQVLKMELSELIDDFEDLTNTGNFKETKKRIDIYITDISIEACYLYFKYFNKESTHMRLYSANGITSYDPGICKYHREWIEALKRHSTLISRCSEMQRLEYFTEQRQFLETL